MTNKAPHKLAVIGSPIGQSLSPKLHNYWMAKLDIDGLYITKDVPEGCLEQAVISMVDEGYTGWNVTIPHKQAMKKLTQSLDISAEQIGAVNTIVNEGGKLKGYNTDADGFIAHLNKKAPNWRRDKPALVLGAGGAARAVV